MSAALIAALASGPDSDADADPKCNRDAEVVNLVSPVYPDLDHIGKVTVLVQVSIDPAGALSDATIFSSSGYDGFDAAAIAAARSSTYKPAVADCRPIASREVFRSDFDSNGNGAAFDIPTPNFSPGADWSQSSGAPAGFELASIGHVVSSWHRADKTLGLSEYIADVDNLSVERALAFVEARLERVMTLSAESTGATTLCSGKLPADVLNFQFVGDRVMRRGSVFITAVHDTIYSFGYTMPPAMPFDRSVPSEIAGFCG